MLGLNHNEVIGIYTYTLLCIGIYARGSCWVFG